MGVGLIVVLVFVFCVKQKLYTFNFRTSLILYGYLLQDNFLIIYVYMERMFLDLILVVLNKNISKSNVHKHKHTALFYTCVMRNWPTISHMYQVVLVYQKYFTAWMSPKKQKKMHGTKFEFFSKFEKEFSFYRSVLKLLHFSDHPLWSAAFQSLRSRWHFALVTGSHLHPPGTGYQLSQEFPPGFCHDPWAYLKNSKFR